jgi:hypothetical protein
VIVGPLGNVGVVVTGVVGATGATMSVAGVLVTCPVGLVVNVDPSSNI